MENYDGLMAEIDDVLKANKELKQIERSRLGEECSKLTSAIIPLKDEIETLLQIRGKFNFVTCGYELDDVCAESSRFYFKTSGLRFFNYHTNGKLVIVLNGEDFSIRSRFRDRDYSLPCGAISSKYAHFFGAETIKETITLVKSFIENFGMIKRLLLNDVIEKLDTLYIQNEELVKSLDVIKRTTVTVTVTEEYI